jgi:hypothetical protein
MYYNTLYRGAVSCQWRVHMLYAKNVHKTHKAASDNKFINLKLPFRGLGIGG